jgi:hypothetical protein
VTLSGARPLLGCPPMRFVIALALSVLAVLGPARTCPAAIPGLVGGDLPVLESCCPRPDGMQTAGDAARLTSACCCSIEERAPGVPSAPVRAAQDPSLAIAPVARVFVMVAVPPVIAAPRAPVVRAVAPPPTLFEQRVLLLS